MRYVRTFAMLLVFVLLAAACSDDDVTTTSTSTTTTTTTAAETTTTSSTTSTTLSSTTTTTVPAVGCGPEYADQYERRYNFDGESPAPFGLLAHWDIGLQTIAISAIFLRFDTQDGVEWVNSRGETLIVDAETIVFCLYREASDDYVELEMMFVNPSYGTIDIEKIVVVYNNQGVPGLLPIPGAHPEDAPYPEDLGYEFRDVTVNELRQNLVAGRQYVIAMVIPPTMGSPDERYAQNVVVEEYLSGEIDSLPDGLVGSFVPGYIVSVTEDI